MNELRRRIRKLTIPAVAVLVGIGVMYYGHNLGEHAAASELWPTTLGKVTVSQVTRHVFTESKSGSRERVTRTSYEPEVRYEYVAFGQRRTGKGIRLVTPFRATPEEAQRELEPYPLGARVRVYVNPTDPDMAVLQPGADEESYLVFYAGLLWTIVWGGVLVVAAAVQYVQARRAAARGARG